MSPTARKEYMIAAAARYQGLRKEIRGIMLNHVCAITGYNRKYVITRLNHCHTKKHKRKPGRPSVYKQDFIVKPLIKIWKAAEHPCSVRLKTIIREWLPFMEDELHPAIKRLLLKMSPATIDRVLRPHRIKNNRRRHCRTKPGKIIKSRIPIKLNQWDERRPGFLEADTVAHCGGSLCGEYVNTIDTVDIATGWTEQRAIFGKSAHQVVEQIQDIEQMLPFKMRGFDSDNGCEFLNKTLIKYFVHRPKDPVQFTRSRPYHKNDNAHVEQKNWTHVRYWFGYKRFDNPAVIDAFNDLYRNEWRLYHNFFLPSVKLVSKERVGARWVKKHDAPQTPFRRLMRSRFVSSEAKAKLLIQYQQLNPFELKRQLDVKLRNLFEITKMSFN
jgi:hypothetical protein